MNRYLAFYRGKKLEIHAASSYEAQTKAAQAFKAKKPYEIAVVLCDKAGLQVTHSTSSL